MADEFEFELDVEHATDVDAAVAATLRSQLNGADEEPAQFFVNKIYQKFNDALPSAVTKTCNDLDTWILGHKTLGCLDPEPLGHLDAWTLGHLDMDT